MNKEIETENNEECFICKEEFNNKSIDLQSFPCNICVKGNWYICKVCNDKIIKNFDKCPVCNTSISHIKIHIKESEDESNEDENYYTYYQKLQVEIIKCIKKYIDSSFKIILISCAILGNLALYFIITFIFISTCDTNCSSCVILSFIFSLINYVIILIVFYSLNDWETNKMIIGLSLCLNGIFIFVTEGIKQRCSGEWDQNLEVIEETIKCECVFDPYLEHVLIIGIVAGCCVCNRVNSDENN